MPAPPQPPWPALRYLHFESSHDVDGTGCLDAMASVSGDQALAALHAEVARVLAWAHATFPHGRGPIDEGGVWDYELQATQEHSMQQALHYDSATGTLDSTRHTSGPTAVRHTVSLTLSGTAEFCAAMCAAHGVDDHEA